MRAALRWAPTIALSWFWGLGFFYAAHITVTQGWPGFLAFALPNAAGLALFGLALERRGPAGLEDAMLRLAARHAFALIAYQALAVGLTVFVFWSALAEPILGPFALPAVAATAFAAMAAGQALRIDGLRRLHAALLPVALVAIGVAAMLMPAQEGGSGGPFRLGLLVPTLVGFLLGPWLDVQQWHRAAAIAKAGGSPARAFALGGVLFFGLILVNAGLVAGLSAAGAAVTPNFAGAPDATHAIAHALGGGVPALLALVWAAVAMTSTVDSAWAAVRWMMSGVSRSAGGPLAAVLPRGLIETPAWTFIAAAAIAFAAAAAQLSLLDLMAPFATLFVGLGAAVLLQLVRGAAPPDATVTVLLGALSLTTFGIGYYAGLPLLTTLAPLLPLAALLSRPSREPAGQVAREITAPRQVATASSVVPMAGEAGDLLPSRGHFDGEWFSLVFIPTYDDTNSVGNVYFANYIRWVGKAREMFFVKCLPKFDVRTTQFLILTRDIYHQFVSEVREFEPTVVRLKIGKYNRKFVSLEHEIRTDEGRLIGKGNQQLMFVDSIQYRLIDIPGEVIAGFFPFASKRHQDAHTAGARSVSKG